MKRDTYRILRGYCWAGNYAHWLGSTIRGKSRQHTGYNYDGFRLTQQI